MSVNRRDFLTAATALGALTLSQTASAHEHTPTPPSGTIALEELTIEAAANAMAAGTLTARGLTEHYLARIEALDRHGPALRSVLELNPDALAIATALDAERAHTGSRGPLHGIPVLIKDNIETADHTMTTAGSLALEGWYAPTDAPCIATLRAAGAVILGKANLSEWANFRSTHSSSGWSGRGGQTRNPYALDRTPSGSSSGSAVAVSANLCTVAVGSETDGSIVSPASVNGVVGIKPTLGLVSRRGIVPLSHSQDTAGPIARTVYDAAALLSAIQSVDPQDPASADVPASIEKDYTQFVQADGLRGARLGIARQFFEDNTLLNRYLDTCVAQLKAAGAIIVDPANLTLPSTVSEAEFAVLLYDYKADLNAYLAKLPSHVPVHSMTELIAFNTKNANREMPVFDQEILQMAEAKGPLTDKAYLDARATCLSATRTQGIDALLKAHQLDAIVSLTSGLAWLIDHINGDSGSGGSAMPAAVAGYPHITVPAGLVRGLPVGLSFFASAYSEPTLIRLASGWEAHTKARVPPTFAPSMPL